MSISAIMTEGEKLKSLEDFWYDCTEVSPWGMFFRITWDETKKMYEEIGYDATWERLDNEDKRAYHEDEAQAGMI